MISVYNRFMFANFIYYHFEMMINPLKNIYLYLLSSKTRRYRWCKYRECRKYRRQRN